MTSKFAITWCLLSLLLSGCNTLGQKQPTQPGMAQKTTSQVERCSLVLCRMPGREAPKSNDDWTKAVDALETELKSCAVQVMKCIRIQEIQPTK